VSAPFPFARVPRRAFVELRRGQLTEPEFRVLAVLYDRANEETWVTRFADLDRLSYYAAWDRSTDYLSKVLRSLRTKGWIAYERKTGPSTEPYVVTLLHASSDGSELGPKLSPSKQPTSDPAAARTGPKLAASGPKLEPPEAAPVAFAGPLAQPDPEPPEPDSGACEETPVRNLRAVQRTQELLGREGSEQEDPLGTPREEQDLGPEIERLIGRSRRRPEPKRGVRAAQPASVGEAVILGEISELVAAGVLIEIEPGGNDLDEPPLCRYPAHRDAGLDWRNQAGRLICGICHPPVRELGR
jgi:hypothetical protein